MAEKPSDIHTLAPRLSYLKRIARQARTEKTKRARLKAKRDKLRAVGKSTASASWNANSNGKPGIFFGKVGDQKGYWQRAATRNGDYKLTLLARISDKAVYKPTFRWNDTISESVRGTYLQKMYGSEITRALRKLNGG